MANEDIRSELEAWWNNYQKYYKTLYDKEMRNNRTQFESARDQANILKERNERSLRGMFNPDSGRGLSLMAGNNNSWMNNLMNYRNGLADANSTSLANYHMNLANGRQQYMDRLAALMDYGAPTEATATGNYMGGGSSTPSNYWLSKLSTNRYSGSGGGYGPNGRVPSTVNRRMVK